MTAEHTRLTLHATVLEDLHSGTGTGATTELDAVHARDRHGDPIIWSSHLRGVLREIAEDLEHDGTGAIQTSSIRRIFGAAGGRGRAEATFTSLRYVQGTGTADGSPFITWHSTARASATNRAPAEDTLRVVEFMRAGVELKAKIDIPTDLVGDLRTIVQRCDALGSGRTRGQGAVRMSLEEDPPGKTHAAHINPRDTKQRHLRLIFEALDPICLPRSGERGNVIRTHRTISGRALEGALAGWLLGRGGDLDEARQSVLRDDVVISDALPLPAHASPSQRVEVVPIPLSAGFRKPSGSDDPRPWWASPKLRPTPLDRLSAPEQPGEKLKRPKGYQLLANAGDGWFIYRPSVSVRMRNRTHLHGVAREDSRDLFSTEEIAEDTLFTTDITFPNQESTQAFLESFGRLLSGRSWLRIGRGGAPMSVKAVQWSEGSGAGTSPTTPQTTVGSPLRLTLTSDLVVRDEWLNCYERLDADAICRLAGLNTPFEVRLIGAVQDWTTIHGFNAASGLPRAPVTAIRRGSDFLLEGAGVDRLRRALQHKPALGERQGQGHGQFRLDFTPLANLTAPPRGQGEGSARWADHHERVVTRARMLLDKNRSKIKDGPSVSQWFAFRNRILAAKCSADIDALVSELGERETKGGRVWRTGVGETLIRTIAHHGERLEPSDRFAQQRLLTQTLVKRIMLQLRQQAEEQRDAKPRGGAS